MDSNKTFEHLKAILSPYESNLTIVHDKTDNYYLNTPITESNKKAEFFGAVQIKKSNESHYGNAIELITIDNNSNSFHKITLSQEYLSEGYEYTLESKFKTKSKVEITKKEFFNISDNIKDNDSISAKRKVYQIKSNGQIIEI